MKKILSIILLSMGYANISLSMLSSMIPLDVEKAAHLEETTILASLLTAGHKIPPTLVCTCARLGKITSIRILVEQGADINTKDEAGQTPAHHMAINGYNNNILELCQLGADFSETDNEGNTPLHGAVHHKQQSTVEFLTTKFSSLTNAVNNKGLTPLNLATKLNYSSIAKILHKAQANHDRDNKGRSPLFWAAQKGNLELFKLFLKSSSFEYAGKTPFHFAAQGNQTDMMRYLMQEYTIRIEQPDDNRRTALHYAAQERQFEAVKMLIELHAPLDAEDDEGKRPLNYTVETTFKNTAALEEIGGKLATLRGKEKKYAVYN